MPVNEWTGTTTGWIDGNFSLDVVPTSAHDVAFLAGDQEVNTSMPATGVDYLSFLVKQLYRGAIGNSSNKLKLGDVSLVIYEGKHCKECWLVADSGKVVDRVLVYDSYLGGNSLQLAGGTFTDVVVHKAPTMTIGAAAVLSTLRLLRGDGAIGVTLESGATLATVHQAAGNVFCHAAAGTIYQAGGIWHHLGDTTFDIAAVHLFPGATFNFFSGGGTIPYVYNYGGTLNADGGSGRPRTINHLFNFAGLADFRNRGSLVNVINQYDLGGEVKR